MSEHQEQKPPHTIPIATHLFVGSMAIIGIYVFYKIMTKSK